MGSDRFTKSSHELRLSAPVDWRLRFVAGLFLERQTDDTHNEFQVDGLAKIYSISGEPGVLHLNAMMRVDHDKAAFGYDVARCEVDGECMQVRRFRFPIQ
jgi:hypothetical protein